jgi:hypothetical protein
VASTGGTGTIHDDGTGAKFTFDGTSGQPSSTNGPGAGFDDDRVMAITDVDVNEGSDYAVFTVTGVTGQKAYLSLSDASGDGGTDAAGNKADLRNSGSLPTIQYLSGTTWTNYDASNPPTLPAGGLKVRVLITAEQDAPLDGPETFKLVATNDGGVASTGGTGTIHDDGTGAKFTFDGTSGQPSSTNGPGAGFDDDRTITVTGGRYNENSPRAVFTVNATPGQLLTLDVLDAADTGKAPTGPRLWLRPVRSRSDPLRSFRNPRQNKTPPEGGVLLGLSLQVSEHQQLVLHAFRRF